MCCNKPYFTHNSIIKIYNNNNNNNYYYYYYYKNPNGTIEPKGSVDTLASYKRLSFKRNYFDKIRVKMLYIHNGITPTQHLVIYILFIMCFDSSKILPLF